MPSDEAQICLLTDGTVLTRRPDGSYRPAPSETDHAKLAALSDQDLKRMAAENLDHPALADAFWAGVEEHPQPKEAISIKLDGDILTHFRRQGRGYQTRINAVMRRYVDARRERRR